MSAIEQRAREMLAEEFEARGLVEPARELRSSDSLASMEPGFAASVAAVIAALTIAESFASQADCAIRLAESAQRRADRAALTPPEGYVLVPVEPTEEMVNAAEDAYMPFGDMEFAIQAAISARPEAP